MGIREVAERAQVSIATVSQVLNGKGSFSPTTKERVVAAAAELGYRPNATAAALGAGRVSGRLRVLGLAMSYAVPIDFPLTDTDYFKTLIGAATEQALVHDYALVIGPPTPQTSVWLGLPLDGVVVVDPVDGDEVPTTLRTRRTPLVVVGRDADGPEDVRVFNDPVALVTTALDHLVARGCSRPALLAYPFPDRWVADIKDAFLAQGPDRGLETTALMVDWTHAEQVNDWLAGCLVGPTAPDAVVCLEDDLATTLEAVAGECGRSIPDDLQVIAVSDRWEFPGIDFTTIELDPVATARRAVDALVDLVEGREVPQHTTIPVRLVQRGSTRAL